MHEQEKDADGLLAEIEALRDEKLTLEREREVMLAERKLERALIEADVRKVDSVRALLDMDRLEVDEQGCFVNLAEQLAEIEQAAPGFFSQKAYEGNAPQTGGAGNFARRDAGTAENPWARERFNLTKQAEIMRKNPALAKRLMKQAGVC